MAVKNPITDALLTLHELTAAEQKARIDYEAAQAKRNLYGQGAVRGVATELAEMRMKKQKQQEAIAKAGEGQQASPQAMVPPTIDVSGQTGGRDMSGSTKAIAELAGRFISPGGPQPAQIQQGGIQGVFGQQGPGGTPPLNPAAGQPVQGPAAGGALRPGPPGSIQPIQQDLSGGEQALGLAKGLFGIAARSPDAAIGGFSELFTGKRTLGYGQQPTVDEKAATLAPALSTLVSRSHSTNPELATAAQQQLDQRRQQIIDELGPEIGSSAMRQAEDIWLAADEARRIKEEDPLEKAKREKAVLEVGIENKVAQHGIESLTPGERDVWERGRRQTTNVINMPGQLDKGGQRMINQQLEKAQTVMQYIDGFDNAFFDEGFELMSSADRFQLTLKDRSGLLNEKERQRLDRYGRQDTAISNLNLNVIHPLIGAAMAGKELEHADGLIIDMSKGGTRAQAASAELREQIGLAMYRYETILESNSMADPRYAMSLGNVRNSVKLAADKRVDDLMEKQGLSEADAVNQMRLDFRNRYGLDIDRLNGTNQ